MLSKTDVIRPLNDQLRMTFAGGRVLIIASIVELNPELSARVLSAIRGFDVFDPENDPYGEHDVAFVEVEGERYFFKIDYFDLSENHHAPDPADPEHTCRVLTIGHHSDY